MCGICGIFRADGEPVRESALELMTGAMWHRGPDDSGYRVDGDFGMGMRRLSIIDLAGGHQPMANEDGTIHLVLNGEIYNYIELRKELEAGGHRFRTRSDVEVLVHLYEEYGTDAIERLNGMFAFCLWDQERRLAWLGRDRLGIKPLVYHQGDHQFVFGSTLDAVAAAPGLSPEIDRESFLLLLTLAYVPAPRSIYRGIRKLPPGHWMVVKDGKAEVHRYWEPRGSDQDLSAQEFEEQALDLMRSSIELRSRSDVPVGSLLSGGVDSSAVTALFAEQTRQSVHTFSADFVDKPDSELAYAMQVAERYATDHHAREITPDDGLDALGELLPLMDEPITDSAIIPSYILCKEARRSGIKVILGGPGGDEIFGGYFRHYRRRRDYAIGRFPAVPLAAWASLGRVHPRFVRHGLELWDKGVSFGLGTSGVRLDVLQRVLRGPRTFRDAVELLKDHFSGLDELERDTGFSYSRMLTDVSHYLPDNVLSLFDKTSMATSIEGRVPLLDHRLVELAFAVPPEANLTGGAAETKRTLKRAMRQHLPASILQRPKVGFDAPVKQWLQHQWGFVGEQIGGSRNETLREHFDMRRLGSVLSGPSAGNSGEIAFALYVFDEWAKSHAS